MPYEKTVKFLGRMFDERGTWKHHIAYIKSKCEQSLGVLISLVAEEWEANQEIIMHLHRALIRSRIDYGAEVYSTTAKAQLNQVESIANEAMRIALGAFRNSPVASLRSLTREPSLRNRRKV